MATVPTTFTAAVLAKIKASVWNTYVRDAFAFLLSVPRSYAYQTAVTSLTNSTATLILFDTELYDTDTMHSTVTNTSRIVANAAGLYSIVAQVGFAASGTGVRDIQMRLNSAGSSSGGTTLAFARSANPGAIIATVLVAADVPMAAGDHVEVFATQNSGGALNTVAGRGYTYISARWVASS